MKKHQVKWLGLLLIAVLFVLSSRQEAGALTAKSYSALEFPPLAEVKLPDYERYTLDNGLVVYLVEDHSLPLVSGSALVKTGSRLEPDDKVGLAELVGILMRSGGTKVHPVESLNQLLEQKAAYVETGIGNSIGTAAFNSLTEDLDLVFGLFAEVIKEPSFDPQQLELAKTQLRGEIDRRNDSPEDILSREFQKLIYGADSPYARTAEYQTIGAISREDLIAFSQTYFRPEQIILGIVGDFDTKAIKGIIAENFGSWRVDSPEGSLEVPQATQAHEGGQLFFVDQPQLSQSSIAIGHLAGRLDSPDYPSLDVLNGVFNGYGGRLFNELRSRQALAYSVYGYWRANFDYPGVFILGGQTRSNKTVALIKSLLAEVDKMRTTLVTDKELSYAKESILNSFVFNFQSPAQTVSRLMRYEYFGYQEDFLFQYQKQVKATTIEDLERVAQKYLQPEKLVTLVVGNNQEIQPPLTSLGKGVTSVDISSP